MCNLYSITTNQAAISALNRYVGNLVPMPGVFPDYKAPIFPDGAEGRELLTARWGLPSSSKALTDATEKRAEKLQAEQVDKLEPCHLRIPARANRQERAGGPKDSCRQGYLDADDERTTGGDPDAARLGHPRAAGGGRHPRMRGARLGQRAPTDGPRPIFWLLELCGWRAIARRARLLTCCRLDFKRKPDGDVHGDPEGATY